jgi:hypothetical protein
MRPADHAAAETLRNRTGFPAYPGPWAQPLPPETDGSLTLADLRLVDYKVRILTSGTEAVTRVMVESADGKGNRWSTVGVSENIVDASFEALTDSIIYKLYKDSAPGF